MIRDPRDVIVSSYFQATRRSGVFNGTLSEFIRSEKHGIRKIITFLQGWYENRHVPAAWMLVRYEDIRADARPMLRAVLHFMGVQDVEDATVDAAVRFADFENLKKLETSGYFPGRDLSPAPGGDEESCKVRKGKVGGYRDYLSPEDLEYIDRMMVELKCPFFSDRLTSAA